MKNKSTKLKFNSGQMDATLLLVNCPGLSSTFLLPACLGRKRGGSLTALLNQGHLILWTG